MIHSLFCATVAINLILLIHPGDAAAHPPSGIVVDDRGRVFFQDGARGVWRVDPAADPVLIDDAAMHWLAIDITGKFADSPDAFGEWFGRSTPKGAKPALIWCSDFPCVIGKDGNLYFAYMHSLKIMRRTPAGSQTDLVTPDGFDKNVSRQYGVTGLTCGPDGTLYLVVLNDQPKIQLGVYAIAMDGSVRPLAKNFVTEKVATTQRYHQMPPEYCRGMAVDKEGNVYVAATGNRCVIKLSPAGTPSVVLTCEKPWAPTGVAEHNGDIYVLEYDDETPTEGRNWPPRVRKVSRDGSVSLVAAIRR